MLQRVPVDEPIVAAEADVLVLGVTPFRPKVVLLVDDLANVGSIPGLKDVQRGRRVDATDEANVGLFTTAASRRWRRTGTWSPRTVVLAAVAGRIARRGGSTHGAVSSLLLQSEITHPWGNRNWSQKTSSLTGFCNFSVLV